MDFRKRFRVEPGSKVKLKDIDPSFHGEHASQAEAQADIDRYKDKLTSMQRLLYGDHGKAPADRAPGDRRRRQGRHLLARHRRHGPARGQGAGLQAADGRGAFARLPLAGPSARARQGRSSGVQPLALRGRSRRARPQAGAEGRLAGALRLHQRMGEAARRRQRHDDPEILPLHLQGRAARPVQGSPRRSRPRSGRSAKPTTPSATTGTTTSTPSRPPSPTARRSMRRGS